MVSGTHVSEHANPYVHRQPAEASLTSYELGPTILFVDLAPQLVYALAANTGFATAKLWF